MGERKQMSRGRAEGVFYRKLWSLMVPIVLQNLMLALVAVADAFMLGGVDQNYMSAVSLATQIQFIQNMFLSAATASLGILGAQYWGKGDKKTLDAIFGMALRLCGLVSAVFFAACLFGGRYLMVLFTNEEVLINYGTSYLRVAAFSYLLTGISQCYLTIMKVSEHAKAAAVISSAAVCVNIALNALFIYGGFGIAPMGVQGAALATLIARILELGCAAAISMQKEYLHPKMSDLFHRDRQLAHDFWKCAMPILGACLFWGVGLTSYSSFLGHMGTDAAAANSVAAVVRELVCCFSAGMSGAAGIMVGNELGAGKLEKGKEYGIRLMKLSFICGIFAALVMCAAIPVVMNSVKLTPEAAEYLKGMFAIIVIYLIGRSVNAVIINGVFSAGGDTMFDMYSLAVCMWCLAIPLAAAGTYWFHWPVVLVYACTCIDEVGKVPWVLYHFKKYKWVKDLTR